MSDTDRMYRLLRERGARGVHTHELRTMGYSGNPSQRAADIEAKYGVTVERERERRNDRNGSRYRLQDHHRPSGEIGGVKSTADPPDVTVAGRVAKSRRASAGGPERSVPNSEGSRSKSGISDGQRNSEPAPPKEAVKARGKIDAPPRTIPSFFDHDADWAA